jgi:outer membrane murein-binding lipoprotein Lpp|tara:strand:+ start:324 stop:635 length:312 start_codon:yes stop_codon:yes gene_type:complete
MELSENSKLTLDLKTIGVIIFFTISLAATYFTLSSSVAQNSSDVEDLKVNSVNPIEFQYKDELVRSTVQRLEEKQDVLSEDINEIKENLKKIDERLYQISKGR